MKEPVKRPPAIGKRGPQRQPRQQGQMAEYGWYDQEIEDGVSTLMIRNHFTRQQALVFYFNNM